MNIRSSLYLDHLYSIILSTYSFIPLVHSFLLFGCYSIHWNVHFNHCGRNMNTRSSLCLDHLYSIILSFIPLVHSFLLFGCYSIHWNVHFNHCGRNMNTKFSLYLDHLYSIILQPALSFHPYIPLFDSIVPFDSFLSF